MKLKLSQAYKDKVREEVLLRRQNFTEAQGKFATTLGIHSSQYKDGVVKGKDNIISDDKWLAIGLKFGVTNRQDHWKMARTKVYVEMADKIDFCQRTASGVMLIEDCGIGKTVCAQHIAAGMTNAFYLDCSQYKTVRSFVRGFARTIGISDKGSIEDIKTQLKEALNVIEMPVVILDEFGDLSSGTYLYVKEIQNATVGCCGWFAMGAEGLEAKINRGMNSKKTGYKELFSRFNRSYMQVKKADAEGVDDKKAFYAQLVGDVVSANVDNPNLINHYVHDCLKHKMDLRYVKTQILIARQA